MTPADRLTAALARFSPADQWAVLEMLELFAALNSRSRATWLASARPASSSPTPSTESVAEIFERGLQIVKGDTKPR